jgi:putative transposase
MRGFPHSNDPEKAVMGELRVGVTLSGWSPVVWIPMKGILRAVKPREEGSIPNNIKLNETRTPSLRTGDIYSP